LFFFFFFFFFFLMLIRLVIESWMAGADYES